MDVSDSARRFVFTGTPGSGKSSVVRELEDRGCCVVHEAATYVISQEQSRGVERPWETSDFIDKIVRQQFDWQLQAEGDPQFFDRLPFCTYALSKYLSHYSDVEFVPSSVLLDEIDRCLKDSIYGNVVFFFDNLGFVEKTDARRISYEDAMIFEEIHREVYRSFGFHLSVVPRGLTVVERADLILEHIASAVHERS